MSVIHHWQTNYAFIMSYEFMYADSYMTETQPNSECHICLDIFGTAEFIGF